MSQNAKDRIRNCLSLVILGIILGFILGSSITVKDGSSTESVSET